MPRASHLSACLLVAVCGSIASAGDTASFEVITAGISANDMSPDGRYIVGAIDSDGDLFADGSYWWDRQTNTVLDISAGVIATGNENATAVSADGSIVVGSIPDPEGLATSVAGIWNIEDGWVSLGYLPNAGACPSRSNAYEISDDGSTVVGLSWEGCSGRGFKWTQANGMEELEVGGSGGCRASVVSMDGSVIAGFCQGNFNRSPMMWDGVTNAGSLLDPSGDAQGEWHGLSDDGTILLGSIFMGGADGLFDAVKWTEAGGLEVLGNGSIIGGWGGVPQDIADDGTVVGFDILLGNRRAWIQPGGVGPLLDLKTYIQSIGATVPAGFELQVAQAISADGRTIIGHTGGQGAWLITLSPDCVADRNDDGVLDFFDVQGFLADFAATAPSADINEDGVFDFFDLLEYLNLFSAGCP